MVERPGAGVSVKGVYHKGWAGMGIQIWCVQHANYCEKELLNKNKYKKIRMQEER